MTNGIKLRTFVLLVIGGMLFCQTANSANAECSSQSTRTEYTSLINPRTPRPAGAWTGKTGPLRSIPGRHPGMLHLSTTRHIPGSFKSKTPQTNRSPDPDITE